MRFKPIVTSLVLAAVAGCSSATAPGSSADVAFTFGIHRPAAEPAFLVQAGMEGLIVRGVYEALTSGYTATASADITGRTLELHVLGKQPVNNYPVISPTGYEAVVRGITTGPLHVRVIHEWSGITRSPVVAFESDLAVE